MSSDKAGSVAPKMATTPKNTEEIFASQSRKLHPPKGGTQNAVLPRLGSNSDLSHEDTDFTDQRPISSSQSRATKDGEKSSKHVRRGSKSNSKYKKKSKHKQHKFETVEMTVQRTRNIILSMLEHRHRLHCMAFCMLLVIPTSLSF